MELWECLKNFKEIDVLIVYLYLGFELWIKCYCKENREYSKVWEYADNFGFYFCRLLYEFDSNVSL